MIFLNILVFIIYLYYCVIDRDYELLFMLVFLPVFSESKMDISLDNPGFNVDITDAEVHLSDPPKSSGGILLIDLAKSAMAG